MSRGQCYDLLKYADFDNFFGENFGDFSWTPKLIFVPEFLVTRPSEQQVPILRFPSERRLHTGPEIIALKALSRISPKSQFG
jgi:hypothetical protein